MCVCLRIESEKVKESEWREEEGKNIFIQHSSGFMQKEKKKNAREKIKLHGLISHPIIHCHTLPHGHVELLF